MPKIAIHFCDWCGSPVDEKDLTTVIIKKDGKYRLCKSCIDAVHFLHSKISKNISSSLYAGIVERRLK